MSKLFPEYDAMQTLLTDAIVNVVLTSFLSPLEVVFVLVTISLLAVRMSISQELRTHDCLLITHGQP